ncbi:hypothetical protein T439DRAFT_328935 [Meredithblackwellia eburnea MCA 4105]
MCQPKPDPDSTTSSLPTPSPKERLSHAVHLRIDHSLGILAHHAHHLRQKALIQVLNVLMSTRQHMREQVDRLMAVYTPAASQAKEYLIKAFQLAVELLELAFATLKLAEEHVGQAPDDAEVVMRAQVVVTSILDSTLKSLRFLMVSFLFSSLIECLGIRVRGKSS